MKYTKEAGGAWMWAERGAVITSFTAAVIASGAISYEVLTNIRIELHLSHSAGHHNYPHLQGIKGPGWGKTIWRLP